MTGAGEGPRDQVGTPTVVQEPVNPDTRDRLRSAAIVALGLALAYFAWRGVLRGWLDSGDLSVAYSGGAAWLDGTNPYDVATLQQLLSSAGGSERLVDQLDRLRNVFAPTTLPLFAPLAPLSWSVAQLVWLALNVGATAVIAGGLAWLLGWSFRSTKAIALGAILLALSPVHSTIASGQTGLVATAALVLALPVQESGRGRTVWVGVLFGLATALKLQIGLPLLAYLAWRRWRAAAVAGTVLLAATIVAIARMALAGVAWLPAWLDNLVLLTGPGGINDPGPLNQDRYSLINLQYPLHGLLPGGVADLVTYLGVGLAAGAVVWLNRGREHRMDLLAVSTVAVLALLVTYHRYYDAVLLAFPIAWAIANLRTGLHRPAIVMLALSGDFILPAQTVLRDLEVRGVAPGWLVGSPAWDALLAQHSWVLVLMSVTLLWAARLDRAIDSDASEGVAR